jgi:hypothetical protein
VIEVVEEQARGMGYLTEWETLCGHEVGC